MKSENEQIKKELEEIKKQIDELKTKYHQTIGELRYISDTHDKFEKKLFYISLILFIVFLYVYYPFFRNLWLSVDPFMRGVILVLFIISFPLWLWFIFNV
jgi:tetrahydromethanopterin S-methyltransferase subunit G